MIRLNLETQLDHSLTWDHTRECWVGADGVHYDGRRYLKYGRSLMSRRERRSGAKRALAHEPRSRIAKVEELAEAGYEPRVIASAAKLPQALVEEMLALLLAGKGGRG